MTLWRYVTWRPLSPDVETPLKAIPFFSLSCLRSLAPLLIKQSCYVWWQCSLRLINHCVGVRCLCCTSVWYKCWYLWSSGVDDNTEISRLWLHNNYKFYIVRSKWYSSFFFVKTWSLVELFVLLFHNMMKVIEDTKWKFLKADKKQREERFSHFTFNPERNPWFTLLSIWSHDVVSTPHFCWHHVLQMDKDL